MSDLEQALRETLLELTQIPSPIGEEKAICDHVERRLAACLGQDAVTRFHDSLVVRVARREGRPRIGLVGHLDTVRTQHDDPPRIEGNRLYGPGSADMKSGLTLMIELAERLDRDTLPYDLTMVFYEREEGPFEENRLGPILEAFEDLRALDLAVCLEPSDNEMQLGAMGSLHATLVFEGRSAHSARPWQGDNAMVHAAQFVLELSQREPKDVEIEGHHFVEVITPTLMEAGRARNVVPDHAEINVNYRFAPGRTPLEALEELRGIVGDRAQVHATDLSPAGRPHATNPLVQKLAACGVVEVKTKRAWTDVARFDTIDVPAVNLGPGNNSQAHQRNEYTELHLLEQGYAIFERFLTDDVAT